MNDCNSAQLKVPKPHKNYPFIHLQTKPYKYKHSEKCGHEDVGMSWGNQAMLHSLTVHVMHLSPSMSYVVCNWLLTAKGLLATCPPIPVLQLQSIKSLCGPICFSFTLFYNINNWAMEKKHISLSFTDLNKDKANNYNGNEMFLMSHKVLEVHQPPARSIFIWRI